MFSVFILAPEKEGLKLCEKGKISREKEKITEMIKFASQLHLEKKVQGFIRLTTVLNSQKCSKQKK